jgi:hypothetical protein
MSALGGVITRAAAAVPLTSQALALVFIVIVATIRPTSERRAMVDHLAKAIKDLGSVISGGTDVKAHDGGRRD